MSIHGFPITSELRHAVHNGAVHDLSQLGLVENFRSTVYVTHKFRTLLACNEQATVGVDCTACILRDSVPHISNAVLDRTAATKHLHAAVCTDNTAVRQTEEGFDRTPTALEQADTNRYGSANPGRNGTPTVLPKAYAYRMSGSANPITDRSPTALEQADTLGNNREIANPVRYGSPTRLQKANALGKGGDVSNPVRYGSPTRFHQANCLTDYG